MTELYDFYTQIGSMRDASDMESVNDRIKNAHLWIKEAIRLSEPTFSGVPYEKGLATLEVFETVSLKLWRYWETEGRSSRALDKYIEYAFSELQLGFLLIQEDLLKEGIDYAELKEMAKIFLASKKESEPISIAPLVQKHIDDGTYKENPPPPPAREEYPYVPLEMSLLSQPENSLVVGEDKIAHNQEPKPEKPKATKKK